MITRSAGVRLPYGVIGVGVVLSVGIFCGSTLLSLYHVAHLTFSNTQVWDQKLFTYVSTTPFLVTATYQLPPPPATISLVTQRELRTLHELATLRNEETMARIQAEITTDTLRFNNVAYGDLVNPVMRPETHRLFSVAHEDLRRHLMRAKDTFDRVRPSLLDPELTTAIAVPGHPSYPSGHATETYFYALVFGALDPAHAEQYRTDAYAIARNREIAGLHYPSDSVAGRMLATWYFTELEKLPWYQEQLARAKAEW
jgi:membrane-associated phospholipid phosphatase